MPLGSHAFLGAPTARRLPRFPVSLRLAPCPRRFMDNKVCASGTRSTQDTGNLGGDRRCASGTPARLETLEIWAARERTIPAPSFSQSANAIRERARSPSLCFSTVFVQKASASFLPGIFQSASQQPLGRRWKQGLSTICQGRKVGLEASSRTLRRFAVGASRWLSANGVPEAQQRSPLRCPMSRGELRTAARP